MEITWYGHSCFRLSERGRKSIVVDPYDESIGYSLPRLKGEIVTVSHDAPGHNNVKNVKSMEYVLDGPGEYEIDGIFITAIATYPPGKKNGLTRNLITVFDYDSVIICHLGDLDHIPAQSHLENLGTIDVALTPVGGGGGLNSSQAAEVISLLEPGIVVPMHYHTPATSLELDPVDKFLKEFGATDVVEETSLKVTSRGSLPEQTQIVLLEYAHAS